MLDNPQSKLNKQSQQGQSSLQPQNPQPGKPPVLRPDTKMPADANTQSKLNNPEDKSSQTVPDKPGFFGKLKQKVQQKAQNKAMQVATNQFPALKEVTSPTSPNPSVPESNQQAPKASIPNTPIPQRSLSAPGLQKPQMPKIPKMRK
jgi:hypothetical protein